MLDELVLRCYTNLAASDEAVAKRFIAAMKTGQVNEKEIKKVVDKTKTA